MVRIYDESDGHFRFSRPNGYVALDTRRPMPARIGSFSVSDVEVAYAQTPGEEIEGEGTSVGIRYWMTTPAYNGLRRSISLGAFSGAVPPSIITGRIRIRRTLQGGNLTGLLEAPLAINEWIMWSGGSLLLEHFGQANKIWMWRYLDLRVADGNWLLECRQGNDKYVTDKSYGPFMRISTASTFRIDLALQWYVFR